MQLLRSPVLPWLPSSQRLLGVLLLSLLPLLLVMQPCIGSSRREEILSGSSDIWTHT